MKPNPDAAISAAVIKFAAQAMPGLVVMPVAESAQASGTPHLIVSLPQGGVGMIWATSRALTAAQLRFRDLAYDAGAEFAVCRCVEDFERFLRLHFRNVPLKSSVLPTDGVERIVRSR